MNLGLTKYQNSLEKNTSQCYLDFMEEICENELDQGGFICSMVMNLAKVSLKIAHEDSASATP